MARRLDVGPKVYYHGKDVDSITVDIPNDREAVLTNAGFMKSGANPVIAFSVGGREIFRYREPTGSQNNILENGLFGDVPVRSMFDYVREKYNQSMSIPVPQGITMEVASIDGTHFNGFLEFEEYTRGSITPQMVNHYEGSHFIVPQTALGPSDVDAVGKFAPSAVVKSPWHQDVFSDLPVRANWTVRLLSLFFARGYANKYASSTDHISRVEALHFVLNGEEMFTHNGKGIPSNIYEESAGSAYFSASPAASPFPEWASGTNDTPNELVPPIEMSLGDNLEMYYEITGDVGAGNIDYTESTVVALLEMFRG